MFKALCQWASRLASAFLTMQKGSILIYTGAFMSIGVGGAALSIDIGRVVLLRTQMQNRADAGALAGAAQLDAGSNAMFRSDKVVRDSMNAWTTSGAETNVIQVESVTFYNSDATFQNPDYVATPTDELSRFVEVELYQIVLSFFYAPAQNLLNGGGGDPQLILNGRAMAMSDPYICKAQPMMICDPFDAGDGTSTADILDAAYAGNTIVLKPQPSGGGSLEAGNFGFLELPEDTDYTGGGATKIQKALQEEDPQGCYGLNTVTTSTGAMTEPVRRGLNVRFDEPNSTMPEPLPAPNIMEYEKDTTPGFETTDPYMIMGDGSWDFATYWSTNHSGVATPWDTHADFPDSPSRYQMYLIENDQPFWVRNGGKETSTLVDEPDNQGGWKQVFPSGLHPTGAVIPAAGVPTHTISAKGYERRLLRLALIRCTGLSGSADEIENPSRYVEVFVIRKMGDAADDGIYSEVVRKLTPQTSLEFHGNVRLVE